MQDSQQRLQRVYELLGAPSLLYRHKESYTLQDEEAAGVVLNNASEQLASSISSLQRVRARWYYPMDYHVIQRTKDPADIRYMESIYAFRPKKKRTMQQMNNNEDDDSDEDSTVEGMRKVTIRETNQALNDWDYLKEQSFDLQQEARLDMLLESENIRVEEGKLERKARRLLRNYQRYDASYYPVEFKYQKTSIRRAKEKTGYHMRKVEREKLKRHSQQRNLFADPAYLAPFGTAALEEAVKEEKDYRIGPVAGRRRQVPAIQRDDPNSPEGFGNCILTFPCNCLKCMDSSDHTWCLLHPTGPVLDRVRLSHMTLPHGKKVDPKYLNNKWMPRRKGLKIGDSIRQLIQCGPRTFVARTTIHFTVFHLKSGYNANVDEGCEDLGISREYQRLDFRSLSPAIPSYFPRDVAIHPKYGNDLVDPKLAILCESDRKERNIIHHVLAASPHPQTTKHIITNLQEITKIDFASHHPMILWAAARSHVRPALKKDLLSGFPSVGHGSSLYSIDLRSNQAAFQWSPSAEESLVEGIHSISGVVTDWNKDNTVLLSSVSAGKTWEIDARMPCQAIHTWSVPYSCDGGGPCLPAMGLHGSGTLLVQPLNGHRNDNEELIPRPILSVGTSPDTFGIHLYQRPAIRPRFQTPSIECAAVPGLPFLGEMSVATSSIYPLPDVSEKVFTCGLASFCTPVNDVLSSSALSRIGYTEDDVSGILCAISMTNKGDLYTHTLLESKAAHKQSRAHKDLPLGTAALTVSAADPSSPMEPSRFFLPIQLCNEFPVPSRAIIGSTSEDETEHFKGKQAKSGSEDRMRESSDEETMTQIDSNPTKAVAMGSGKQEQGVKLKSNLVEKVRTELESTLDCFDHDRKSSVENRDPSYRAWRSDITPGVIDKATAAWDEDSDDESL